MSTLQLVSPKTFAARLDCSLSMLYRLRKEDKAFPEAAVKLFGSSKRGFRWLEEQVQTYIASKGLPVEETAAPFVPIVMRRSKAA